jgi:hypothetical protein
MFFSFYSTGKMMMTRWEVEQGSMEVETKIELLAGLECIATKTLTTFENESFRDLETIE